MRPSAPGGVARPASRSRACAAISGEGGAIGGVVSMRCASLPVLRRARPLRPPAAGPGARGVGAGEDGPLRHGVRVDATRGSGTRTSPRSGRSTRHRPSATLATIRRLAAATAPIRTRLEATRAVPERDHPPRPRPGRRAARPHRPAGRGVPRAPALRRRVRRRRAPPPHGRRRLATTSASRRPPSCCATSYPSTWCSTGSSSRGGSRANCHVMGEWVLGAD